MAELDEPAMPWQAQVLDVAYELDEEATEAASSAAGVFQPRLWFREADLTVPRQSGKTTKAKARHAHRMRKSREYGWARRPLSFYMAQTATDARDKMVEEWFPAFEDNPRFFIEADQPYKGTPESQIAQFIRSNGREQIKWAKFLGGGRITVKPPSRTGGHGGSPDLIDLDEAFAHRDGTAEQGVRPGMITKVSPQLWVVSTAGTAESEYLWNKVDEGRQSCVTPDASSRRCYFEWSAYPGLLNSEIPKSGSQGIDLRDPDVLRACSPALGFTITLDNLLADIGMMDPDEAARAYGNIWTVSVKRIISAAAWARNLDPQSQTQGRLWLAVDASPGSEGGRSAAIAICGYNAQGKIHGEIVDEGPGLSWVAPRVGEITRKWRSIEKLYLDNTGPVRAIETDIRDAAACGVDTMDANEMAAACQRLHEDVLEGNAFRHIGQDVLDDAVAGAAKRTLGDSWAWARRTSAANIAPLVALTEAYWGAVNNPPRAQGIM